MLGIEDMRCKITGSTTPISVVRAVFQGLLSQVRATKQCLPRGCQIEKHMSIRFFQVKNYYR